MTETSISRSQASSSSPTHFLDAIQIDVLADECIRTLTSSKSAGEGLKKLRLVSKQVNAVMLKHVRSFHLTIDGGSKYLPDGHMLKSTQLSCLWLHVIEGEWLITIPLELSITSSLLNIGVEACPWAQVQPYRFKLCRLLTILGSYLRYASTVVSFNAHPFSGKTPWLCIFSWCGFSYTKTLPFSDLYETHII